MQMDGLVVLQYPEAAKTPVKGKGHAQAKKRPRDNRSQVNSPGSAAASPAAKKQHTGAGVPPKQCLTAFNANDGECTLPTNGMFAKLQLQPVAINDEQMMESNRVFLSPSSFVALGLTNEQATVKVGSLYYKAMSWQGITDKQIGLNHLQMQDCLTHVGSLASSTGPDVSDATEHFLLTVSMADDFANSNGLVVLSDVSEIQFDLRVLKARAFSAPMEDGDKKNDGSDRDSESDSDTEDVMRLKRHKAKGKTVPSEADRYMRCPPLNVVSLHNKISTLLASDIPIHTQQRFFFFVEQRVHNRLISREAVALSIRHQRFQQFLLAPNIMKEARFCSPDYRLYTDVRRATKLHARVAISMDQDAVNPQIVVPSVIVEPSFLSTRMNEDFLGTHVSNGQTLNVVWSNDLLVQITIFIPPVVTVRRSKRLQQEDASSESSGQEVEEESDDDEDAPPAQTLYFIAGDTQWTFEGLSPQSSGDVEMNVLPIMRELPKRPLVPKSLVVQIKALHTAALMAKPNKEEQERIRKKNESTSSTDDLSRMQMLHPKLARHLLMVRGTPDQQEQSNLDATSPMRIYDIRDHVIMDLQLSGRPFTTGTFFTIQSTKAGTPPVQCTIHSVDGNQDTSKIYHIPEDDAECSSDDDDGEEEKEETTATTMVDTSVATSTPKDKQIVRPDVNVAILEDTILLFKEHNPVPIKKLAVRLASYDPMQAAFRERTVLDLFGDKSLILDAKVDKNASPQAHDAQSKMLEVAVGGLQASTLPDLHALHLDDLEPRDLELIVRKMFSTAHVLPGSWTYYTCVDNTSVCLTIESLEFDRELTAVEKEQVGVSSGQITDATTITFVFSKTVRESLKGMSTYTSITSSDEQRLATLEKIRKGKDVLREQSLGGMEKVFNDIAKSFLIPHLSDAPMSSHPPLGLLLHGPPGTGKTELGKAIAQSLGIPSQYVRVVGASEMNAPLLGQTEEKIRSLFKWGEDIWQEAKAAGIPPPKCLLILDEVDSLLRARGSSTSWSDSYVNQFLSSFDKLNSLNRNMLVVGITNRKWVLDGAVLRPGRLGKHVEVKAPDHAGRQKIMAIYLHKLHKNGSLADGMLVPAKVTASTVLQTTGDDMVPCLDIIKMLAHMDGYTGARIKDIVRIAECAVLYDNVMNQTKRKVGLADIEAAHKKMQAEDEEDMPMAVKGMYGRV